MGDPVAFLQTLIRAQPGGEAAVQRVVADAARALGCTVETVRYRPADVPMVAEFASAGAIDEGERASVVATFRGKGGGRSVIFFAHPDGEPVAGTETWKRDPFAGIVDNGRIHGWGVADDLAGVAILIQGLQAVLEAGHAPAGDVILASTPSKRHRAASRRCCMADCAPTPRSIFTRPNRASACARSRPSPRACSSFA